MFKRPHYIALIAVLLLVLITLSLPGKSVAQLKLALSSFFLPLFGLTRSTESLATRARDTAIPKSVLRKQIAELTRQNQELMFRTMQSTQLWQENQKLRQALEWEQTRQWNLKPATVVFREPATWWRTLQIDLGRRDGVKTNMPVMTPDGLVGKIAEVGFRNSHVILIGDPECKVAAAVRNPGLEAAASGIIGPSSATVMNSSVVRLTMVDRSSELTPGDPVETSGLGPVFPKGLPIGRVLSTNTVGFGLMNEATVKLAANLKYIEYVWVLFP